MASVDRVGVGTDRRTAWPQDITQKRGLTHPLCSASQRINKPMEAAAHMGSHRREVIQREWFSHWLAILFANAWGPCLHCRCHDLVILFLIGGRWSSYVIFCLFRALRWKHLIILEVVYHPRDSLPFNLTELTNMLGLCTAASLPLFTLSEVLLVLLTFPLVSHCLWWCRGLCLTFEVPSGSTLEEQKPAHLTFVNTFTEHWSYSGFSATQCLLLTGRSAAALSSPDAQIVAMGLQYL